MRKYNLEEKALKMKRKNRSLPAQAGAHGEAGKPGSWRRIAEQQKHSSLASVFSIEYTAGIENGLLC
jgi:hypothetical protein